MSANLEVKGFEELLKNVEQLGKKGKAIQDKALLKAAQPILDEAVRNAPHRTGKGRSLLKISRPKSKGDQRYVIVGLDKGDTSEAFYMKFMEWGTSAHIVRIFKGNRVAGGILKSAKNKPLHIPSLPARPFLGPAYERNKKRAIETIKEEMRKGLGLE